METVNTRCAAVTVSREEIQPDTQSAAVTLSREITLEEINKDVENIQVECKTLIVVLK